MDRRKRLRGECCWFCDQIRISYYFTCPDHRKLEDKARAEYLHGLCGHGASAAEEEKSLERMRANLAKQARAARQ